MSHSPPKEWAAFDKLDPRLREALRYAEFSFDPCAVLRLQNEQGVEATLRWLAEQNRSWIAYWPPAMPLKDGAARQI